VARIALDRDTAIDLDQPPRRGVARRAAEAMAAVIGGTAEHRGGFWWVVDLAGNVTSVITHPLWTPEHPTWQRATAALGIQPTDLRACTTFDALRRPGKNRSRVRFMDALPAAAPRPLGDGQFIDASALPAIATPGQVFTLPGVDEVSLRWLSNDAARPRSGATVLLPLPPAAGEHAGKLPPLGQRATPRERKNRDAALEKLQINFADPTNTVGGMKGTLWAAFNAATEYADYQRRFRSTSQTAKAENRLDSIWFGSGNEFKQLAYGRALELVKPN